MHAEYTIRALKAGKHVLCEKPMANTPADCEAMIDGREAGGPQADGRLPLRYEPFNQEMIRMAREQELGPVEGRSWPTTASTSATRRSGG